MIPRFKEIIKKVDDIHIGILNFGFYISEFLLPNIVNS